MSNEMRLVLNTQKGVKGFIAIPIEERFWAKVNKEGPLWNGTACWLWTGAKDRLNYGRFNIGGQMTLAHRYAYETLVALIPEGLEPDHLCRVPSCVNPEHLEPVTHKINIQRGNPTGVANLRKTHCPKGHPYDLFNTYTDKRGKRSCSQCRHLLRIRGVS